MAMNRKSVESAFITPAYRRVDSEEGAYDTFAGYNVIAKHVGEDRIATYYGYVGLADTDALRVFTEEVDAQAFADIVDKRGYMACVSDCWAELYSEDIDALPDYVENPGRPEYN